jgi:hypothetical protein
MKISVVTPVYNGEIYIRQTVESVSLSKNIENKIFENFQAYKHRQPSHCKFLDT